MYNLTALCTILPHCVQSYRTVHKITYGPLIDTALYVMCLMGANLLLRPLEGLGHESLDFFGPKQWVHRLSFTG